MEIKERPACSLKNAAFPEEIGCPRCGAALEMWSDEEEALCGSCGSAVMKKKGL
jgi:hypothetical protein